jgi:hypothetical protein
VLTVRYRRPTPLLTPLRIEARVVEVVGRRSTVSARMFRSDLADVADHAAQNAPANDAGHAGKRAREALTADAEGIFVAVDSTRLHEIFAGKHT